MIRKKRRFPAPDRTLLGTNPFELALLDEATQRAAADIDAIVKALDSNAKEHKAFIAEIARLRASSC
jgi:hypothetical protein